MNENKIARSSAQSKTPRSKLFVGIALAVTTIVAVAACKPTDTQEPAHAPTTVVPGSYEDWCGEHGVPESQCTRCHAELIPAFKATNDWCAEHGLPESHCTKCNPTLVIARPPRADAPKAP